MKDTVFSISIKTIPVEYYQVHITFHKYNHSFPCHTNVIFGVAITQTTLVGSFCIIYIISFKFDVDGMDS